MFELACMANELVDRRLLDLSIKLLEIELDVFKACVWRFELGKNGQCFASHNRGVLNVTHPQYLGIFVFNLLSNLVAECLCLPLHAARVYPFAMLQIIDMDSCIKESRFSLFLLNDCLRGLIGLRNAFRSRPSNFRSLTFEAVSHIQIYMKNEYLI